MIYKTRQQLRADFNRGLRAGELDPASSETARLREATSSDAAFARFQAGQVQFRTELQRAGLRKPARRTESPILRSLAR